MTRKSFLFWVLIAVLFPGAAFAQTVCAINSGTPNDSDYFGYDVVPGFYAVQFTPASTCVVGEVGFQAWVYSGTPPSGITVSIVSDSAGKPSYSTSTSATVPEALIPHSSSWSTTTVPVATLSSGTPYWLVLSTSFSSAGWYRWAEIDDSSTGKLAYYDGGAKSWSTLNNRRPLFSIATAPPPPPPPAAEIFASSTIQESPAVQYSIVDNPTDDLYHGILIFAGAFVFVIWLFRRARV
jgi:hypothetical protein